MTPRGTLGLCCVHNAQLMTHPAVYILPFTLQLCYKPLGILQRVTKSQKVHRSSHDVLQNSHTCEEGGAHLRISFWNLLMNFEEPKESKIKKKNKKNKPGDIIILDICTKNYNQVQSLRYGVTHFFCHLGPFFALYPSPLTPHKTKILRKRKKHLEKLSFYTCATKNTIK